jgi:hypothetical protein
MSVHGPSGRLASVQVYVAAAVLAALLVYVSTLGLVFMICAIGAAILVAMLAFLGADRMGYLLLLGAFFTAPSYKGFAPSEGAPVTGTDLLFVAAFGLLLPTLMQGKVRLPTLYFLGVGLVLSTGLISSALSSDPLISFISLTFWMMVMIGLPVAISLLAPSGKLVDLMAAMFIAGQLFSMAYGIARGYVAQGRHAGFSTHPNYFAQAGMLALALCIYLGYRHRNRLLLLIVPAAAACGVSVILSGSRAATLVVAVLVLMVPVVERSALTGFLLAALGALGFLLLPFIAGYAGSGSSIARLASGDTSARYSNSERSLGIGEGIDRFFDHPLRGTGMIELYEIHNNFLEVAVAIGIFGLVGYLMVLYTFARPIFSLGEYRRLAYCVWGYIGFGATVPSLYDRSIWAVMALSVVAMIEHERLRLEPRARGPRGPGDPGGPGDPAVPPGPGLGVQRRPPVAPDRLVPTVPFRDPESTR